MKDVVATTVLEMGGVNWASSASVAESVLRRRPGVRSVSVNALAQTATVTFDEAVTSVADLTSWIRECGYHCAGQSVPEHICDPMMEPGAHANPEAPAAHVSHDAHAGHSETAPAADAAISPHDAMGHGGSHAGM